MWAQGYNLPFSNTGQQQSVRSMYDTVNEVGEKDSLLRKLDCTRNESYSQVKTGLLNRLEDNRSLVSVRLINMHITDEDVTKLCTFIASNKCLSYIDLDNNSLSGRSIVALIGAVLENPSVRSISCCGQSRAHLTDLEEEAIVAAVETSETLYYAGVNISDDQLKERLKRRLSENRRRWVLCPNTRFERKCICPLELPHLGERCILFLWWCKYQWSRVCNIFGNRDYEEIEDT